MSRTSTTPTITVYRVTLLTDGEERRFICWSAAHAEAARAARYWRKQSPEYGAYIRQIEIPLTKRGVLATLRRQAEREPRHPGHRAVRAI